MQSDAMIDTFDLGGGTLTSRKRERGQNIHFTPDDKVPRFWKLGFHYWKVSHVPDEDAAISGDPAVFLDFKLMADHGYLPACRGVRSGKATEYRRRHHETRQEAIFGFEDADVPAREHGDLFGIRDMGWHHITNLFGCEDTAFQLEEKGRYLVGSHDPDIVSSLKARKIFGRADAHGGKYDKTRHIFGDGMAEDSDTEDFFEGKASVIFIRGVEGELIVEKDFRHEHGCVHVVENLLNSLGAFSSQKYWKVKGT